MAERVVLITGGSSGIGLATVQRLAAGGDRVFTASRSPTRAELPDGVTPIVLDVSDRDPGAAEGAVASVLEAAGRLDVLINNAGTITVGPMEEATDDEAHRVLEVNLFGPMRLARAAIPVMRDQRGGRIVNVTSMNDVLPAPFAGWYSPSKAALASASVVLGAEVYEFGIFVTVVAPGLFATEMFDTVGGSFAADGHYGTKLDSFLAQQALRRQTAADPDVVARSIEACLDSDDPPARVVVGADANAMAKFAHGATPEDLARAMRSFVANLNPR